MGVCIYIPNLTPVCSLTRRNSYCLCLASVSSPVVIDCSVMSHVVWLESRLVCSSHTTCLNALLISCNTLQQKPTRSISDFRQPVKAMPAIFKASDLSAVTSVISSCVSAVLCVYTGGDTLVASSVTLRFSITAVVD